MKPGIHPSYGPVVFRDMSTGDMFLTRSTLTSKQTVTWHDGQEYPLVDVDVTSKSHPLWTGNARVHTAEGRVARFNRRYGS